MATAIPPNAADEINKRLVPQNPRGSGAIGRSSAVPASVSAVGDRSKFLNGMAVGSFETLAFETIHSLVDVCVADCAFRKEIQESVLKIVEKTFFYEILYLQSKVLLISLQSRLRFSISRQRFKYKLRHWPPGTDNSPFVPPFFAPDTNSSPNS